MLMTKSIEKARDELCAAALDLVESLDNISPLWEDPAFRIEHTSRDKTDMYDAQYSAYNSLCSAARDYAASLAAQSTEESKESAP
jgi:hypothetical protein